jgi:hypothetical protein
MNLASTSITRMPSNNIGAGTGNNSLQFDSLMFVQATEPSALALFSAGFVVLAVGRISVSKA